MALVIVILIDQCFSFGRSRKGLQQQQKKSLQQQRQHFID
jgi:hypothetical protein